MRKLRILLVAFLGIVILGVAAIWVLANPNRHRDFIQKELETRLGRKVTLGEMSLGLLPLRFQVRNVAIAEDPNLGRSEAFVEAQNVDIRVRLLPLLSGNIQVDSVELVSPRVELVRTKAGAWNFASIGAAGPSAEPAPSTPGAQREFSLERLSITDGQIGITDLQQNRPRSGYDHIDLTLLNFSAGKPFAFDLGARVQGESAQELRLKGEGGPISASSPANTPFQGTLTFNNVGIEGLMSFLNVQGITKAKGTLTGQSNVASRDGALTTSGQLKLDKAQVNDLDIGYPISLDYKLAVKLAEGLVDIENATLQLGQTPLTLSGSMNTSAVPPTMDVKIKSGDASIAEIARLASAFGVAFAPGTNVRGRVSLNAQARGSTSKPQLTGSLAGRDLEISGNGIPQPVQVKAVDLTFTPSTIRSNEFTATSGKSTVLGQFTLAEYASASPSIDLGLRTPAATLPEIQSIARAYGVKGLDQISGEGALNFDLRAKGPLQSLNTASATKALNGTINLDFSPLKIAGFDTAHELGLLGGFASGLVEKGQTDILKMIGKIVIKDGIAQTDDLRAQLGIGNVSAGGTADLAAEALNLKLSAVFTKEFSDKVGARRGGGLLNTVLTNTAGEIVLPALVTGNFQKPKFAPDLKAVALLQRQKYLPSLDNPAAAIGNILGGLTGRTKTDPAAAPEGQPEGQKAVGQKTSVVKGILDILGGQKNEAGKKDDPAKKQ